nr:low specificity L-threonine aldolase-like [Nerophis lumbriciformis]
MAPYGSDPLSQRLPRRLAEIFETDRLEVLPMAAGTGANALALGLLAAPQSRVICQHESHIYAHECGAPEFYIDGARLEPLAAEHARLTPATLTAYLQDQVARTDSERPPTVLSLTQATELGTVYQAAELTELADLARHHGLRVHLDGARFANAVAATGASPAELSWKAGVNALAFGGTKNGALAAEALLIFDPEIAAQARERLKRGGQQWAKERFLSAQHLALLEDDLWLRNAHHANHQAARLAEGLVEVPGVELAHPVETNQVFAELGELIAAKLEADGYRFWRWRDTKSQVVARFVCAFDTPPAAVDQLVAAVKGAQATIDSR